MTEVTEINVNVVEGELTDVQADVYVNSTNKGLNLKLGSISKSILEKAGSPIQKECKKKYPNGIKTGMIAVTQGYKLKCKQVFHGALNSADNEKDGDPVVNLCQFVCGCLKLAYEANMSSIAFPPLGTGFLGYEPFVSAHTMYQCFSMFERAYKQTSLKTIYIVIYTKGGDWMHVKHAFNRELHRTLDNDTRQSVHSTKENTSENDKEAVRVVLSETCIRLSMQNSCKKELKCGHICAGYKQEKQCPPCLVKGCADNNPDTQNREDDCIICYTDQLAAAPVIVLKCGHIYHLHCVKRVLDNKWVGAMISFNFMMCPICKARMHHPDLAVNIAPLNTLYEDVSRKALMRLEFEGLSDCPDVTTPGSPFYQKPQEYALQHYCYYSCYKCKKAYFGGAVQCQAGLDDANFNAKDMVCAACSGVKMEELCKIHGTDFIEYKCRYCCTLATYFCMGMIHLCITCHDNWGWADRLHVPVPSCPSGPLGKRLEGKCPLGIKHAPNGTEFSLGCGLCANLNSF